MKKILFFTLLIAVIIGASIAASLYFKGHEDMHNKKADHVISSYKLFQEFQSNEAMANEKYIDKIIEVTGTIGRIDTGDSGEKIVYLTSDDPMFGVLCEIDNEEKLMDLQEGMEVTLKGICSGFLMDVALNRCVQIK